MTAVAVVFKRCGHCRRVLVVEDFPIDRGKPDGRHGYCRGCNRTLKQRERRLRKAMRMAGATVQPDREGPGFCQTCLKRVEHDTDWDGFVIRVCGCGRHRVVRQVPEGYRCHDQRERLEQSLTGKRPKVHDYWDVNMGGRLPTDRRRRPAVSVFMKAQRYGKFAANRA